VYFEKLGNSIKMPFRVVGLVDPRSDVLDGVQIPHGNGQFFFGGDG